MSDPRVSAHRFRLGILLAVVTLLALGSFWVLDVMRRGVIDEAPKARRIEPDYFIENFNYVRMAKTGLTRYHISGARMTHNPVDDTFEITRPVIKSLSANLPPTTIGAQRALADLNASQMQLFDKVEVDRPASAAARQIKMTSDYMLVLPDEDVIKTHRPVDIVFGDATLKGTGMYANQSTREFTLSSQVQAVFPPNVTR